MASTSQSSLQPLDGFPFPVFASAGAEARAGLVAARCERALRHLSGLLGITPRPRLLVLAPGDWAANAAFPFYGMPHIAGDETLVVGATPADFWQGVIRFAEEALSPAQLACLEEIYGTADGRLDPAPFADLLAVHELAHLFHIQVPFVFPRLWLMEFFANLCLHTYLAAVEPEQLPVWTGLPEAIVALPPERFAHRSLADFERLYAGVGPENYSWYQFRLIDGGRNLYAAAGAEGLRRLYQTFALHASDLDDEELARLLEARVHPAAARMLREWPD